MVIFVKSELQLIVEFVHIFTLVVIFIFYFIFDLEADSLSGLLELVLLPFFVVDLLLALEKVQGVFFADVAVLGKELDVLQLKVHVKILEFV